jgi:hypothetical protein
MIWPMLKLIFIELSDFLVRFAREILAQLNPRATRGGQLSFLKA